MMKTILLLSLGILGSLTIAESANSRSSSQYYGAHLCQRPGFQCIKIHPGDTWETLFPNQHQRDIVKRLNRTNVTLGRRNWIVVPSNLHYINPMELSPFPKHRATHGKRILVVKLSQHAFGAYNEAGNLVHWGPISGGKNWCKDVNRSCSTATGHHKIYRKQGAECVSSKYPIKTKGGAPMPYCMHYYKGYALHGSTLPGFHASHGCIRLFHEDAKWLNKNFLKIGTKVIVTQ